MLPNAPDTLYQALAFHEAGHQVIADALGVPVRGVEITMDRGRAYDGLEFQEYTAECMLQRNRRHYRAKVMILLAGELAEEAFYEESKETPNGYWSGPDRAEIDQHVKRVFGDSQPFEGLGLEELELAAVKLIDQRWDKVRWLAEVLLERKKMTATEVKEVLRGPGIVWDEAA